MLKLRQLVRTKLGHESDPDHVRSCLQNIPQIPATMHGAVKAADTIAQVQIIQKPSFRFRLIGYNGRKSISPEANQSQQPSQHSTIDTTLTQTSSASQNTENHETSSRTHPDHILPASSLTENGVSSSQLEMQATQSSLGTAIISRTECLSQALPADSILAAPSNILPPPPTMSEMQKINEFSPTPLSPDCFVAMYLDMDPEFVLMFNKAKPLIRAFLCHLRLEDPRISLDCAMVGKTAQTSTFIPTVLFICFNENQKKSIEIGIAGNRKVIPSKFSSRVVVQELSFISFISSFAEVSSNLEVPSYNLIEADLPSGFMTLCGVRARMAVKDNVSKSISQSLYTIGGLVRVGDEIFGLTTGHSFVATSRRSLSDSFNDAEFEPIGELHSYEFTELPISMPSGLHPADHESEFSEKSEWTCQDWALIRISPSLYRHNAYRLPGQETTLPIRGHFNVDELSSGEVWICAGISGMVRGFLNGTEGSVMYASRMFTVRTIVLDKQLSDGDSGSWVVRNSRVCGYVFSRVVGCSLAYMLPIGPVLKSIGARIQEIQQVIASQQPKEAVSVKRAATKVSSAQPVNPLSWLGGLRSRYNQYKSKGRVESQPAQISSEIPVRKRVQFQNPLASVPISNTMQLVDDFAKMQRLNSILPLLRKGALIARDPTNYEGISGPEALSGLEIEALRDEVLHKWRRPYALYLTIATCSAGAVVTGWVQTGSKGANLSFSEAFGIGSDSTQESYLVRLIDTAPYISSVFVGCWASLPLNNRLGRRGAIFVAGNFCLWAALGSAFTQNWVQLLICRLLVGLGMGVEASTVPILAAEISPLEIRGALLASWALFTALGTVLGYCANLAVADVPNLSWRLQIGSAFIPAVPLCLCIYFCPESPHWYIKKGQYQKAYQSLCRLRNNPVQASRDLFRIFTSQVTLRHHAPELDAYTKQIAKLLTVPRLRRATLASLTLMISHQLCGISVIAPYSSTLFIEAGATATNALIASLGCGLVNFIFTIPAIWTIDKYGRRPLLLFSFPTMAWSMLATCLCSLIPGRGGAHLGLVATFVYIFALFNGPGGGAVPFTYSAEAFPLSHSEAGMALAVAANFSFTAAVRITLPSMISSLTVAGTLGIYAAFSVIASCLIFLCVPETKQCSPEGLDYIFSVSTRMHIHYELTRVLPWWIRRYILRRQVAPLEPLYRYDLSIDHTQIDHLHFNDGLRAAEKTKRTQPPNDFVASLSPV